MRSWNALAAALAVVAILGVDALPARAADGGIAFLRITDDAWQPWLIAPDGSGGFNVTGTHSYPDVGPYPLATTITSLGGSSTIAAVKPQLAGLHAAHTKFLPGTPAKLATNGLTRNQCLTSTK